MFTVSTFLSWQSNSKHFLLWKAGVCSRVANIWVWEKRFSGTNYKLGQFQLVFFSVRLMFEKNLLTSQPSIVFPKSKKKWWIWIVSFHFKGNDGCVPNSVRFKFGVENLQILRSSRVPERLAPSVLPSTKEIHMGNSTTNFRKSTPISAWRLVGNGNPVNPIDVSSGKGSTVTWHAMIFWLLHNESLSRFIFFHNWLI